MTWQQMAMYSYKALTHPGMIELKKQKKTKKLCHLNHLGQVKTPPKKLSSFARAAIRSAYGGI
jgi:hypothetical protein